MVCPFLWPSRIMKVTTEGDRDSKYLVFCYGQHSEYIVAESNITSEKAKFQQASKNKSKGVDKAFAELESMPVIYRRSKTFAAMNLTLADPEPATSGLLGQVATVQAELEKKKLSLKNDIARKVAEMATGGGSVDTIK